MRHAKTYTTIFHSVEMPNMGDHHLELAKWGVELYFLHIA